ncbi:MAG TPA: quinol:cytochrome C oxidoreductase [Bacteroidia bacterium]|jgi:hypothetical protein|nr:quinol:cytochrome C oxidoreductase [Bacteroidia bacterium]
MSQYTLSSKTRTTTFVLIGIGILALAYGAINKDISGTRFWANILLEGLFFTFISIGAAFFMALQYVAQAGWSVVIKRTVESLTTFLPFGLIAIFAVLISSVIGGHNDSADIVYKWMQKSATIPGSPAFDEMLVKKGIYLNVPFVLIRTIICAGLWVYMVRMIRKRSIESDLTNDFLPLHYKNVKAAGWFIVFFGITEQLMAWDWVMAIDHDWHSTLFGWYLFDDMWLTGVIATILLTLHVRKKGLLKEVNENHMHNLGLWMFALSVLWGYLWFFQFMFYWYTNIPDEVVYFQARINHYRLPFWIMFCVNLLVPLLIMMTRDTKRNTRYLTIIGCIILITHWIDAYIWVMPGTMGISPPFGLYEIGLLLGFVGLFLYVVLTNLAKVPVSVKNHPYLEESLHHHL